MEKGSEDLAIFRESWPENKLKKEVIAFFIFSTQVNMEVVQPKASGPQPGELAEAKGMVKKRPQTVCYLDENRVGATERPFQLSSHLEKTDDQLQSTESHQNRD